MPNEEEKRQIEHIMNLMMRPKMKHYMSFHFRQLLKAVNYELLSVTLVKDSVLLDDGYNEVPVAKIMAVRKLDGAVSYPNLYPRYLPEKMLDDVLGLYDDIVVRFSIKRDGKSFYTPCWESIRRGTYSYEPRDFRIDWDKILQQNVSHGFTKNPSIKKYYDDRFRDATETMDGFHKALIPYLVYWLDSNIVQHEG